MTLFGIAAALRPTPSAYFGVFYYYFNGQCAKQDYYAKIYN